MAALAASGLRVMMALRIAWCSSSDPARGCGASRSRNVEPNIPTSILDVGCGGGSLTVQLGLRYPRAHVLGIDIASEAINFAEHQPRPHNVEFRWIPTPQLDFPPKSFDVVTCSLVLHHLADNEIVQFLKEAVKIARHAVIINDLHRHPMASWSYKIISPMLFPNRMVIHDGLLSIQRSFTKEDLEKYFHAAGLPKKDVDLSWRWAFRWVATINTSSL